MIIHFYDMFIKQPYPPLLVLSCLILVLLYIAMRATKWKAFYTMTVFAWSNPPTKHFSLYTMAPLWGMFILEGVSVYFIAEMQSAHAFFVNPYMLGGICGVILFYFAISCIPFLFSRTKGIYALATYWVLGFLMIFPVMIRRLLLPMVLVVVALWQVIPGNLVGVLMPPIIAYIASIFIPLTFLLACANMYGYINEEMRAIQE